ncbi:chorismate mutase [Streptacidiphilus sp. PB12-B1b]|uniref:chorismate mutase n=1 Tax=Streptacidiphilus sp. PB12-B1b TaxID=2705012 RepID=UPI0015FA358C|nr:chorismate mutase [Streptacidiphilus sp. PB12-B1b]QMU77957.1 chorismate mutase [Streptacidiphilus sp. PB12-B1b]
MSGTPPLGVPERQQQLDRLDDAIIALLQERRLAAGQLRALRSARSLPASELVGENRLLARYREALGSPGTGIALELLALARTGAAATPEPLPHPVPVPVERTPS